MEKVKTGKDKNKEDLTPPEEDARKKSSNPKEEKDTRLAKRSGQRPALPFKRKPPS